ncbi:MAG: anti-sigma factor antagonist, partial [Phycisphaeraceae bacterium]
MASQESRLVVEQDGGVTRVGFLDRNILEEASIQQIGDEIGAIIQATPSPKIMLNFDNVEHLSSAALG